MTTPTEQHLGEALEDLVSTQPFQPDIPSIQRRGRTLRRRSVAARTTAGAAVTAVAALDNYVWEDSEDALQAGAGNPQVREGILRILSTLPGITVTRTEAAGQPALAITASGAPDLPANYHETITINASTGLPISLVGGTNGAAPSVTETFQVSRVTVSAIKAGRF